MTSPSNKSKSLYITTEEKNKWIEKEKQFLQKQKEISGNKNASILSQITFCKDGVIIEKFMELNDEGGIAVKVNNYLLSDHKPTNTRKNKFTYEQLQNFPRQ